MSIKVTLGEAKTQTEKPFPKLMISQKGNIIFMKDVSQGTIIHHIDPSVVGYYLENWDMDKLTDYNEPITLQND